MSEERVEQALRHLGEELRFSNPAQAALRQARRMRLRRNTFGGVGAVVAVAAITVPFVYLPRDAPSSVSPAATPSAAAPSASTSPSPLVVTPKAAPPGSVALPGGVYVAGASNDSGSLVYDPKQRRYRSSGYPQAWVSPDGRRAVVADRNKRLGLLDLASNAVRWVSGSTLAVGTPGWSNDSRQVVFAGPGRDQGTLSIVLVNAATAKARTLRPAVPCVEFCQPSWLPGNENVVLPQAARPTEQMEVYSVKDGRLRTNPFAGAVQTRDAWSPEWNHVVTDTVTPDGFAAVGIVDSDTGKVTALFDVKRGEQIQSRAVVWATPDEIVAAVEREFIVFSPEGKELRRISLPPALRGPQNDLSFARP